MSDGVLSSFGLLLVFDDAQVADTLDLGRHGLLVVSGLRSLDHVSLGTCVLHSALLFFFDGTAHL